jgi:hypothetical protein
VRSARWIISGFVTVALLVGAAGCTRPNATVVDAFPEARRAAPWVLTEPVWSGSFADAESALGLDAAQWGLFNPQHVWLAVYQHEDAPSRKMTVRIFSFETAAQAAEAYARSRPHEAEVFDAGDEGCWTQIGVMFVWDRLVCEVFGQAATLESEVQAATLSGYLIKHMPPGLPDAPR